MKLFVFVFSVWLLLSPRARAEGLVDGAAQDPYSKIEHITLENEIQLFLAPSETASTAEVRVEVATGLEGETAATRGVSHLLEHVIFRDKGLKDEMTYLQLIKEAGGAANGTTGKRRTSFFGSIPHAKAGWLFETITKMVLHPSFEEEYVAKEKGTIELERGRPGPITVALGFNPVDYLELPYLRPADFDEKEFGIEPVAVFTSSEEQLSTRRLTAEQVRKHYEDYYVPSNMKVFVSGRFDRKKLMSNVKETWAALPKREGLILNPLPKVVPRLAPFVQADVTEGTPTVRIGTKAWDMSVADQQVTAAYMEYLAHRLMKQMRNLKAETYTASAHINIQHGHGISILHFGTPRERLDANLTLARNYIQREAEAGALSESDVREAISLYLANFKLRGREARDMQKFAKDYADILEDFGTFTSPYAVLAAMTPAQFNESLKRSYSPVRRYEVIDRPSLLFEYDSFFLFGLTAIGLLFVLRKQLTGPFANERVRWIRNVKYPLLRSFEILAMAIGALICAHVIAALSWLVRDSVLIESSLLLSHYVAGVVATGLVIVALQGVLCLLPKKLMVVDRQLWIKSLTYYSRRIEMAQIESVESVRPRQVLFSKRILKVRHRYAYFHWMIWRKGLLINLKSGRSYFFSVTSGDKAAMEFALYLERPKSEPREISQAS